jgi:antirestriction protein ArdC
MSDTSTTDRAATYRRVTDRIVAAIEAGTAKGKDWRMPWHRRRAAGAPTSLPMNVTSRSGYRGINTVILWGEAEAKGYEAGLWGTYRQWKTLGAQVRGGEKAATVVYWQFPDRAKGDDTQDGEEEGRKRAPWAKAYSVFNVAQVEGYAAPADAVPVLSEERRIAAADGFFSRLPGLTVQHGGTRAFYVPATDQVQMPRFADFHDAEGYYGTLAHEVTHWTGHSSRLARDLSGRFRTAAYAAEELVAELGAAFLSATLGLATEPREDHAQYVAGWLELLRGDPRAIFTAASKAQQAVDWQHVTSQSGAAAA